MDKGQFYIFGAIVLIAFIFLSLSVKLNFDQPGSGFKSFSVNYVDEARVVLNNALLQDLEINVQMRNYTNAFLEYATGRNTHMGIFYAVVDSDLLVANYLNTPIWIINEPTPLMPGQERNISVRNNLSIVEGDQEYNFYLDENIDFKALVENYG